MKTIIPLCLLLAGCATGTPTTDSTITIDPGKTLTLRAYKVDQYTCPGELVMSCDTNGGGGRASYYRCGCATSETLTNKIR